MKTHRNILIISLSISLLSLLLTIILPQNGKTYEIALAFMGSAFIAFMIELPAYYSLKQDNLNKLYQSLLDLKAKITFLSDSIVDFLEYRDIIIEKFYENNMQSISIALDNLKSVDSNFYFFKKNKKINMDVINALSSAYNNLNQSALKFTTDYYTKKININKEECKDRSIQPAEMKKELNLIIEMCTRFVWLINEQSLIVLPRRLKKRWIIDNSIIINVSGNSKIMQNY